MLWLPALGMFVARAGGCTPEQASIDRVEIRVPAEEAGHSAAEAEGVVLF